MGNSLSTIAITVEDVWNQLCRLKLSHVNLGGWIIVIHEFFWS